MVHGLWWDTSICPSAVCYACPLRKSAVSYIYAFLPNRLQSAHKELLTAVTSKGGELGFESDHTIVVTYFERSAISAVLIALEHHARSQGCFYHLTQSHLGLSSYTVTVKGWSCSVGCWQWMEALKPIICVRHGIQDTTVLLQHDTLLYGKS